MKKNIESKKGNESKTNKSIIKTSVINLIVLILLLAAISFMLLNRALKDSNNNNNISINKWIISNRIRADLEVNYLR